MMATCLPAQTPKAVSYSILASSEQILAGNQQDDLWVEWQLFHAEPLSIK